MSTACPEDNQQCRYGWCTGHEHAAASEHIDRGIDEPIFATGGTATCYACVDTANREPDEIHLFVQKGPDDDGTEVYLTAQQAAELISRLTEAIANRAQIGAEVEGSVR